MRPGVWAGLLMALLLHARTGHAADLGGIIAGDTTLTRAGGPYQLVGDLTVNVGATLTLDPGVEITATDDFRVYVNGTLQASGTAILPVLLRATDRQARGAWGGVYVAVGGRCLLTHTTVKNARTNLTAVGATVQLQNCSLLLAAEDGFMAWRHTALQAASCHFDNNTRRGLYLEGYEATGRLTGCYFRGNGEYPVYLKAASVPMLGPGNVYANNGAARVGVSCSLATDLTADATWTAQRVPYDLGAGAGDHLLTVAAGATLTLARGCQLTGGGLEVHGRLHAFGDETNWCRFLSRQSAPTSGDWTGLTFHPGSTGRLDYVEIAHAATGITADSADVRLTNSLVRDCQYDGVWAAGNGLLNLRFTRLSGHGRSGVRLASRTLSGVVRGCQFLNNGDYPLWALAPAVGMIRNLNTFAGNAHQRVGVSCGENPDLLSGTHTWTAQPVPLDTSAGSLGSVLSVGPGAILILPAGLTLYSAGVTVQGRLETRGTAARPVTLLPPTLVPQPGDWQGLSFTGATGSLAGTDLAFAETGLDLSNSSPVLQGCTLRQSAGDGLRCRGHSAPVVTSTRLLNNGGHGVAVQDTAWPSLGNLVSADTSDDGRNRFAGNAGYDVYNGTVNALRAQNNRWPASDSPGIAARIYDRNDNPAVGLVHFEPAYTPPTSPGPAASGTTGDGAPLLSLTATPTPRGGLEVRWHLAAAGTLELRLTNLAGRVVATLLPPRPQPTGPGLALWQGRTANGTLAPPGAYLLRAEYRRAGGNRQQTTRLVSWW